MYGEEFKGYLLKFTKSGNNFPDKYINPSTYKTTPQQRTEIKANRDNFYTLHRTTIPNHKTKITFSTTVLDLNELREILEIINSSYANRTQRKVVVEYWDDELLKYRTMTAYIPDITYTKRKITSDNIKYEPLEISLIEY